MRNCIRNIQFLSDIYLVYISVIKMRYKIELIKPKYHFSYCIRTIDKSLKSEERPDGFRGLLVVVEVAGETN